MNVPGSLKILPAGVPGYGNPGSELHSGEPASEWGFAPGFPEAGMPLKN
jgi:hypothetical protein